MAIGTPADSNLSRDDIITIAYRKLGITTNTTLTTRAAVLLNMIVREQDLMDVGQAKDLWALNESTLKLSADGFVYTTADGLDNNILDIVTVHFRDTGGTDSQVSIIDQQQYEQIANKDEKGDTTKIYLKKARLLSDQILYVWPGPDTVGDTTIITGTDSLNYTCIMGHTSIADNRPITGANWRLYWRQTGTGGVAWATGTAYTNGELLRYVYKRPIYDFDLSTENKLAVYTGAAWETVTSL